MWSAVAPARTRLGVLPGTVGRRGGHDERADRVLQELDLLPKEQSRHHLSPRGGGGREGHMLPFTRIALPHFQGETG